MRGSTALGLVLCVACQQPPDVTPGAPSATATATATTAATTATSSAAPTADACPGLRKAVVDEAAKLASCKTDADCTVHRTVLCNFDELDCHAAHVNKSGDTAQLDKAVSAYAASCDVAKCKCEVPDKSICSAGKCAGE